MLQGELLMFNSPRITVFSFISTFLFSLSLTASPTPIKNLDLDRYQGTWHQLAAIPASFQKNCIKNTTAEYSQLPDGLIKVVNSCDEKNGKTKSTEGRARINEELGLNSTLEVTVVKLFGWIWSFGGDYWVTYINKNYDTVIVAHPDYDFGWILSKKKTVTKSEYKRLSKLLIKQGYDTCEFIMSETPKQKFKDGLSLCGLTNIK